MKGASSSPPAQAFAALPPRQPAQAIVLIALLMIVLLAFIGLAVDGGTLYFTQRNTRNAADAAMLAATYQLCRGGTPAEVQASGLMAAEANGFNNDGATNRVTVNNPPTTVSVPGNPNEYVEVLIWADSPTYLIQLVYPGPTETTARAVGHCRPGGEAVPFSGYALVGLATLNPNMPDAVNAHGNSLVRIYCGGVFSNSTHGSESMWVHGTPDIEATDTSGVTDPNHPAYGLCNGATPQNGAAGGIRVSGAASISPAGIPNQPPITDPLAGLGEPPNPGNCRNPWSVPQPLPPGCYSGFSVQPNQTMVLAGGGVYYFTGSVNIKGTFVEAAGSPGLMIFQKAGSFETTAQSTIRLHAMSSGEWAGMLFYQARDNTNDVGLWGGAEMDVTGTFYAPNAETFILRGNSNSRVVAQVLANAVDFAGTSDFEIIYDESKFYKTVVPPRIEISE